MERSYNILVWFSKNNLPFGNVRERYRSVFAGIKLFCHGISHNSVMMGTSY